MVKFKNKEKFNMDKLQNYTKEITMLVVAVGLIAIGYANYQTEEVVSVSSSGNIIINGTSYETAILANDNTTSSSRNELTLGDVELVSSEVADEDLSLAEQTLNNITNTSNETSVNTANASTNAKAEENYFTKTKLERDTMYSQMIENYEKMINNENLASEQKAIAMQEISNITQDKNAIMIAENLIQNKGYEDVVILKNDENVNVIVSAKKLETEDIAKIQNIVTRELNVDLANINITCK